MSEVAEGTRAGLAEQARRLGVADRYHGFWGKEESVPDAVLQPAPVSTNTRPSGANHSRRRSAVTAAGSVTSRFILSAIVGWPAQHRAVSFDA